MPQKIDCWTEIDYPTLRVIRIFKNRRAAFKHHDETNLGGTLIIAGLRKIAVEQIRQQVFARDDFTCVHCGVAVTWESGEMHERIWKGRGGEVSVKNCETRCHACNMLEHDRNPKFSKQPPYSPLDEGFQD